MVGSWRQFGFLIALIHVLIGGLIFGLLGPRDAARTFLTVVQPNITTTIVLFLMAYSLDSSRLRDSLCHPAGALWGTMVNLGFLPLVSAVCAQSLSLRDFSLGLVITSVSPSTLATASVFTRRAGGNDAISLLVTLLSNVACVALTPLWLHVLISEHAQIPMTGIVRQLVMCVLLPTVVGQLCLWPRAGRTLAERYRPHMGLVSQLMVMLIVAVAAVSAGLELRRQPNWPSIGDIAAMAVLCALVHSVGLLVGWYGGTLWRLAPQDRIATAIAGSQKTLPVGLLIAATPSVVPSGLPFVTFPLLTYHAIQLVMDTAIADAWRTRQKPSATQP